MVAPRAHERPRARLAASRGATPDQPETGRLLT